MRVEAIRDAFEDDDALSRARKLRGECGALWDTCCAATRRVTELKLGSKLDALGSDASAALLSIPLEQQVELQKAASAAPRETPSTPTTPIAGFDELAAAGANLEEATRAAAELLPEDELAVGCEEELFSLQRESKALLSLRVEATKLRSGIRLVQRTKEMKSAYLVRFGESGELLDEVSESSDSSVR